MSQHSTAYNIACSAMDQLGCADGFTAWFESLAWAAGQAAKGGMADHAHRLSAVIQYLACDFRGALVSDVTDLNSQLDQLDSEGGAR